MLEFAWRRNYLVWLSLNLICWPVHALANMTLDEKIRYGMVALSGASIVIATLGVHVSPLTIIGGMGGS
jgi:hypothetical protein